MDLPRHVAEGTATPTQDCFSEALSTSQEVLEAWAQDDQTFERKKAAALELKAFLDGCGCFDLVPCLVRTQKLTKPGCIYKQTISSGPGSYLVHRLAILGSLPSAALKRGYAHRDHRFDVAGYYLKGSERFAPLGPMWFLGAQAPDTDEVVAQPGADKPIQIEILDLVKALAL